MDIIKEIKIKNFRSIRSLNKRLLPSHLNILVGQNDQGKSNILRALNLFFNGQTDAGESFRFEDDYSYYASTGRGSRVEIKIELLIQPPSSRFRRSTPVKWTKIWKKDGSIREIRKHPDGSALSDRNNVSQWLNKLRYRYVPAIKGQDYFSNLMGELHDVLNAIHSDELAAQGEGFIGGIQNITEEITTDLEKQLGIPNTIQVPSDFKVLFSNLDFGLKKNGYTYHLKQRGDGIKVRHIPVILKYMSEQEKRISTPGYVKPDTIWGFEEPENNLEFKYAFEVAEEIKNYSTDIQIFLTTHSPAFYSLDESDEDGVNAYYVSLGSDECTEISTVSHNDNERTHADMGFLPIITPYIEKVYEHEKKLNEALEKIQLLEPSCTCYILTEDSNTELLQCLLEYNGFDMDDTEILSYEGAESIHAAIVLGRYIWSKNKDVSIVIHRDKDYLTDEQIATIQNKVEDSHFFFFTTKGTDIESYFVNADHILELYPQLESELVNQFLEESTAETKEASLKRMTNHHMAIEKPRNGDYYGRTKELEEKYEEQPERFRYGKKVLNRISSKIQSHTGANCNLTQYSDHILIDQLVDLSDQIWGGE
ncbi:MAG: AAA family ATPase [Pseudomonadales bacterium]|nr:AAA family ATPase [Pseudomonadales bacterium]